MLQKSKTVFIKLVKTGWFVIGLMSLMFGIIGAFLPLLPTTVFVIFAAFCFGKSSPKTQAWLENTKIFGPMILDWKESGAIALRYKVIAVSMMGVIFVFSLMSNMPAWLLLTQASAMIAASGFIITRPHS